MKRNREKRRLSAGTVFMLILSAAVICGSALVLGRLSSGASVDLNKLKRNVLNIQDGAPEAPEGETPQAAQQAAQPAAAAGKEKSDPQPAAGKQEETQPAGTGSFTLTLAGTVAFTDEIRKNCRSLDAKDWDFSDIMMLIAPKIDGDVRGAFLENLLSDSDKATDTVAPAQFADVLQEGGFGMAACGFSQAWAKGADGITATRNRLKERGILPLGIRDADAQSQVRTAVYNGVCTAILQYTDTISAKTRKSMEKAGETGMVPAADAEAIAAEIARAREQGANAVIVLMNWGKVGKDPDKNQRALAEAIAQAGADLIVGSGSRVPQAAEYLAGKNGKQVLCVWSLGTLLSGDRPNTRRVSGYLLHVTVRQNASGGAEIEDPRYTPVYTWKYKQDGRFYYRCVAADQPAPDGMDNEQKNTMAKAEEIVRGVLDGSPVKQRGSD